MEMQHGATVRVFYHHSRLPRSRKRPDVAKVRIRAPIASVPAIQIRSFSCDEFVGEVWVTVWGWMGEACWYFVWLHELIHIHMTHTTWRSKVGGYKDTQGRLIVYWNIEKNSAKLNCHCSDWKCFCRASQGKDMEGHGHPQHLHQLFGGFWRILHSCSDVPPLPSALFKKIG